MIGKQLKKITKRASERGKREVCSVSEKARRQN